MSYTIYKAVDGAPVEALASPEGFLEVNLGAATSANGHVIVAPPHPLINIPFNHSGAPRLVKTGPLVGAATVGWDVTNRVKRLLVDPTGASSAEFRTVAAAIYDSSATVGVHVDFQMTTVDPAITAEVGVANDSGTYASVVRFNAGLMYAVLQSPLLPGGELALPLPIPKGHNPALGWNTVSSRISGAGGYAALITLNEQVVYKVKGPPYALIIGDIGETRMIARVISTGPSTGGGIDIRCLQWRSDLIPPLRTAPVARTLNISTLPVAAFGMWPAATVNASSIQPLFPRQLTFTSELPATATLWRIPAGAADPFNATGAENLKPGTTFYVNDTPLQWNPPPEAERLATFSNGTWDLRELFPIGSENALAVHPYSGGVDKLAVTMQKVTGGSTDAAVSVLGGFQYAG